MSRLEARHTSTCVRSPAGRPWNERSYPMKVPAASAASSRTSISMSSARTSIMDGISVNEAAASMYLVVASDAVEGFPGKAEPVRCRQRAQANQRVARSVTRIGAGEKGQFRFAVRIEDQRRGGWPQTPEAGTNHHAACRSPSGSERLCCKMVDERRLRFRRGRIETWPEGAK